MHVFVPDETIEEGTFGGADRGEAGYGGSEAGAGRGPYGCTGCVCSGAVVVTRGEVLLQAEVLEGAGEAHEAGGCAGGRVEAGEVVRAAGEDVQEVSLVAVGVWCLDEFVGVVRGVRGDGVGGEVVGDVVEAFIGRPECVVGGASFRVAANPVDGGVVGEWRDELEDVVGIGVGASGAEVSVDGGLGGFAVGDDAINAEVKEVGDVEGGCDGQELLMVGAGEGVGGVGKAE
jgi:hypothetical protein